MGKNKKPLAKKKFGQNFLNDQGILEDIIDGADVGSDDVIIEIGPGRGALTKYLVSNAKKVYCIEIDEDLREPLSIIDKMHDNVEIVYDDFLKIDFDKFLRDREIDKYKVVANLPYYITTPILMKLYDEGGDFESITVMVQKEVGERLLAEAGTKAYGALTPLTQVICDVEVVCEVPNTAFYPVPKVDSLVIKLSRNDISNQVEDLNLFKRVVKAAFFNRRKKIVNSMLNSSLLNVDKASLTNALCELDIDIMIRGEKLELDDFIQISNKLANLIN